VELRAGFLLHRVIWKTLSHSAQLFGKRLKKTEPSAWLCLGLFSGSLFSSLLDADSNRSWFLNKFQAFIAGENNEHY
jgi:hypothetical protein